MWISQDKFRDLGQRLLATVAPSGAEATQTAGSRARASPVEALTNGHGQGTAALQEDLAQAAKKLLKELLGMPIPTAPGQIVALGSVR